TAGADVRGVGLTRFSRGRRSASGSLDQVSESSTDHLIGVLHASQHRLTDALDGMTAERALTQSYDDDWTVAQVASHLGSGAETFTLFLDAGLKGEPTPGVEAMQPIWDVWDAKDPLPQTRDSLAVNEAFLERID